MEEFEQQDEISDWETYQEEAIFKRGGRMPDLHGRRLDYGSKWPCSESYSDNVGYLWLKTIPDDILLFAAHFETALLALNDSNALILDIRINQGGSDEMALSIASQFSPAPFLAFTEQAVGGNVVDV